MLEQQTISPVEVDLPPVRAACFEGSAGGDPALIATAMGPAFETLMNGIRQRGIDPAGPPRTIYTVATAKETRFIVAVPVTVEAEASLPEPLTLRELEGGRFLRFEHRGPYARLQQTYQAITEWLIASGRMASPADWDRYMPMWEEYTDDPETTAPEDLTTLIYLPVR